MMWGDPKKRDLLLFFMYINFKEHGALPRKALGLADDNTPIKFWEVALLIVFAKQMKLDQDEFEKKTKDNEQKAKNKKG